MTTPPRLLGTYATPAIRIGDVVRCARRGDIFGQTLPKGRARALVLYGDLAEAVRRESAEAVMHFWGVKANTVWAWRKALNVGQYTEGTRKLKGEAFAPHAARVVEAARPTWEVPSAGPRSARRRRASRGRLTSSKRCGRDARGSRTANRRARR